MKWNEHPGPNVPTWEEIWSYRCRSQNIYWEGDEMAAMLSNTLSDVEFYSFGDYYYCDWSDLVAMFLDLFSVPHSKDLTWPRKYSLFSYGSPHRSCSRGGGTRSCRI